MSSLMTKYKRLFEEANITISQEYIEHENIPFFTLRSQLAPDKQLKGRILIVHGWNEHSEMYLKLFHFLGELGFECLSFDQRGSGKTSPGKYRGQVGSTRNTVYTDVDFMVKSLLGNETESKKYNLYLLGHSMGGGIVLNYLTQGKFSRSLKGVILTNPLVELSESARPSALKYTILRLLASVRPNCKIILKDPEGLKYITSSPEWQTHLATEPLCSGEGTIKQIYWMIERGILLKNLNNIRPDISLLMLLSKNDRICSSQISKNVFKKISLSHKCLNIINNSQHALLIDSQEIINQVNSHIASFLLS